MKLFYEYIIQEKDGDYWLDRYVSDDRRFVEELLKVFRDKNKSTIYRVVRKVL